MGGRPKGGRNREGSAKPGPKPHAYHLSGDWTDRQIRDKKLKILELLSNGTATTLSDAATMAGVRPANVWHWNETDPDFQSMLKLTDEVVADRIEKDIQTSKNPILMMFLLKKIRPEYRDNYRTYEVSGKLTELLEKLRELACPKQLPPSVTVEAIEIPAPKPAILEKLEAKES